MTKQHNSLPAIARGKGKQGVCVAQERKSEAQKAVGGEGDFLLFLPQRREVAETMVGQQLGVDDGDQLGQ